VPLHNKLFSLQLPSIQVVAMTHASSVVKMGSLSHRVTLARVADTTVENWRNYYTKENEHH
jgi:galactose-1-phosphate uridylyltransferase